MKTYNERIHGRKDYNLLQSDRKTYRFAFTGTGIMAILAGILLFKIGFIYGITALLVGIYITGLSEWYYQKPKK